MTLFELVTMVSIFCGQVDDPRHFNYCLCETVECVMEKKQPTVTKCLEWYIEDIDLWKRR